MTVLKFKKIVFLFMAVLLFVSCEEKAASPRPYGYHRIDLPARGYRLFDTTSCPYVFEYPLASRLEPVKNGENACWMNLFYPGLQATIYLSYKPINAQTPLDKLIYETQRLTYKHVVRASSIEEKMINRPEEREYGMLYEVGGEAASATQFYLTDSSRHFLRGSLYFYSEPRPDSLAPVVAYVLEDVRHLLETFRWK